MPEKYRLIGFINMFDVYPDFVELVYSKGEQFYQAEVLGNKILDFIELGNEYHDSIRFFDDNRLRIRGKIKEFSKNQTVVWGFQLLENAIIVEYFEELVPQLIYICNRMGNSYLTDQVLSFINYTNADPTNLFLRNKKNLQKSVLNYFYNKSSMRQKKKCELETIWKGLSTKNFEKFMAGQSKRDNFIVNDLPAITKEPNNSSEKKCSISIKFHPELGWLFFAYDFGKMTMLIAKGRVRRSYYSEKKLRQLGSIVNSLSVGSNSKMLKPIDNVCDSLLMYTIGKREDQISQVVKYFNDSFQANKESDAYIEYFSKSVVNYSFQIDALSEYVQSIIAELRKGVDRSQNREVKLAYGYILVNCLQNEQLSAKLQKKYLFELYDLFCFFPEDERFNEMYCMALLNLSSYSTLSIIKKIVGKMLINYREKDSEVLRKLYARTVYNAIIECDERSNKSDRRKLFMELENENVDIESIKTIQNTNNGVVKQVLSNLSMQY